MIKLENVNKTYKVVDSSSNIFFRKYKSIKALDEINLEIHSGEVVGMVGLNGAGKTTLIKIMTGLISPDKGGLVRVDNFNPCDKKREYLKEIALVSGQKNQLIWDLTALDSFKLNKAVYEIDDNKFHKTIQSLANQLGVEDKLDVPVRKLSLGQKMKLEIISAMLHSPKLLYLDEPTIGLDIITQTNLREFIKEYHKKTNATIILTSHNIADISYLCDRFVFLDKGHIIYDIKTDEMEERLELLSLQLIDIKSDDISRIDRRYLEKVGKIISYDRYGFTLQVHRADMAALSKYIFENCDVSHISITENSLDDVIKGIYGKTQNRRPV